MIHRFSLIEKLLLAADVLPHPLLDGGALVGAGRALTLTVKTGLADHLDETAKTARELGRVSGLSEKGVAALLDCLDALGYVRASSGRYRWTKRGKKFLAKGSPTGFRYMMRLSCATYESLVDLETTVREGSPRSRNLERFGPEQWEDFARAMIELARTNVDDVVRCVPVPKNAKRLLDIGGCHGLYSAALCKQVPGLQAEVMDFDAVRPYFEETMIAQGTTDRVAFRTGDLTKDPLGAGYDIVLAFNIVHGFDHAANQKLVERVRAALNPGGLLVVLDQLKDAGGRTALAKLTTSFMALNLMHSAGGTAYSFDEVRGWGNRAGFTGAELKKLRAPGFGVAILRLADTSGAF